MRLHVTMYSKHLHNAEQLAGNCCCLLVVITRYTAAGVEATNRQYAAPAQSLFSSRKAMQTAHHAMPLLAAFLPHHNYAQS
jgi:hypothetical protein